MADVTVVADTATAHVINLLARTLTARNPLITVPPADSPVWEGAGDYSASGQIMKTLSRAVTDPFFLRVGGDKELLRAQVEAADVPWLIAATNIGLAGLLQFPRAYLRDVPAVAEPLTTLAAEDQASMSNVPIRGASWTEIIEKDTLRVPFARVALSLAYETIVKSGLFDKIAPPDTTTEKAPYAVLQRGQLLAALLRVLAIQTPLLRVRPLLRYLRMEQSKTRLREILQPANVEYWEGIVDRVLNMPVHPWIARAEEATLPANRKTPWGPATPTILLERGFLSSPWDGRGEPTREQRSEYADAMAQVLDPAILLESVQPLLKGLHTFMLDLDVDGRFAKIASLLRFVKPSTPRPIPLWSDSFHPVFMDGLYATEAISDLITTSYQIHLPAQGLHGTPWVGEDTWFTYTGAARIDGEASPWSENTGFYLVSPTDVVMDEAFYSNRFTPQMFKAKSKSYRGEIGAVFFTATLESIASIIGRTVPDLTRLVIKHKDAWRHIFEVEGDAVKPRNPSEILYYSSHTAQTWLTPIELPRRGAPSIMWALRRGLPDSVMGVRARFLRDTMVPEPTVPIASAVTKIVTDSTVEPLLGVK